MEVPLLIPRPRPPRGKTPPTGQERDTDPVKPNPFSLKLYVDIQIPDLFLQNRYQISKHAQTDKLKASVCISSNLCFIKKRKVFSNPVCVVTFCENMCDWWVCVWVRGWREKWGPDLSWWSGSCGAAGAEEGAGLQVWPDQYSCWCSYLKRAREMGW